jgi:hypothetical protein
MAAMDGNGWKWMEMDDNGWQWVAMGGNGWQWMAMDGNNDGDSASRVAFFGACRLRFKSTMCILYLYTNIAA